MINDASKYEILFDLPDARESVTEVGGYRTKTIRAGDTIEIEAFPITRITQDARREKQRRESSPAQELLNRRNARKRLRRLAEANFTESDYFVTLTYNYGVEDYGFTNIRDTLRALEAEGLPMDDERAQKHLTNFIKRVKRRMKALGLESDLKYIYVTESTEWKEFAGASYDECLPPKYHHHMILSAPGLSREEIEKLWKFGYVQTKKLDFRYNGIEDLCNYITKSKKGKRKYGHSLNLVKPRETVSDRKLSRNRARRIAEDVRSNAREILEKLYPGYSYVSCEVKQSDFVAGAYIYARLRRRTQ